MLYGTGGGGGGGGGGRGGEVAGGLLLDYGSKGPGFRFHLQLRFFSLQDALSPTSKIE